MASASVAAKRSAAARKAWATRRARLALVKPPPEEPEKPVIVPKQPGDPVFVKKVRYKKLACGWRQPCIGQPGVRMPPRLKSPNDVAIRLQKLGAIIGETDAAGWTHYTTNEGAVGRFRLNQPTEE